MARSPRSPRVELDGAVALVTGAGSGIGRATALALAGRGAHVVCVDRDTAAAEKAAAACAEAGVPGSAADTVDVADRDAMTALADRVHAEHGPLGVLVNNAGVGMTGRLADMDLADWDWIRSINLDGVVTGCRLFGPAMIDAGQGQVVNVASALGYTPTASEPAYVTTKAGVLALSQCLRADWAGHGVGVTAVCPGLIDTSIIDHTRFVGDLDEARTRKRVKRLFKRGHPPEQVADAIVDAIDRDRAVVPVGAEAKVGWALHRVAPVRLQQAVARKGRR